MATHNKFSHQKRIHPKSYKDFFFIKNPSGEKNVLQYLRKFPGNFRRASSSHINCRALLKLAIVSNCHFYFHDFASLALIEKVFEILLCKKKFPDL